MRLVCLGVATGISHTTSGAPTSSMAILDRVTGLPIAMIGVGGGVVRSLMRTFQGNLSCLPACVVVLSPSVMTFVDLPVYLQLMTLQKVRVTVLAPSSVLDVVVQYVEDVLAEEDPAVALAVQKLTRFVDVDPDAPTILPTARTQEPSSAAADPSLGTGGGGGRMLRNIRNDFDDVVLSQWLLFVHKTASPVRDDAFRFNAVIVHRRVVLDGASKHKAAAAAALEKAISAASTLSHLDDVVKEDTTTMLAVVDHIPTALDARSFIGQCDAVLTSLADESMVRQRPLEPTALPTATEGGGGADAEPPSVIAVAPTSDERRSPPALILFRFPAHEPPLTFHPQTFVAQPSCAYSIMPGGGGVTVLGKVASQSDTPPVRKAHGAGVNTDGRPRDGRVVGGTTPSMSPLGAKMVTEDLTDSDDDMPVRSDGSNQRAATMPLIGSAAIVQLRRHHQQQQEKQVLPTDDDAVASSPSLALPFDPATCPFASSLRAEHYDAGMSQLAEMQRQLASAGPTQDDRKRRAATRRSVDRRERTMGPGSNTSPPRMRQTNASKSEASASPEPSRVVGTPVASRRYHHGGDKQSLRSTVFHCCCFDEAANDGAPPLLIDIARPSDPLVCDPLSLGTTHEGRAQLEALLERTDLHAIAVGAAFVLFLQRVQFGVAQWAVTRRMQETWNDNRSGSLAAWREALQTLLLQGVRCVLQDFVSKAAAAATEAAQHPTGGNARRNARRGGAPQPSAVQSTSGHPTHLATTRALHHLRNRVDACCAAVVTWRTAYGDCVDGFEAFGEPSPTTQYDIVVSFH